MSNHIQPVPDSVSRPAKGRNLRLWLLFGGIFLTVLILLTVFLLARTTVLDGLVRNIRYLGRDETVFSYDSNGVTGAALLDGDPVLCDQNGVTLYTDEGTVIGSLRRSLYTPVLRTEGDYVLLYDIGGTLSAVLDNEGRVVSEQKINGKIIDAALAASGQTAVLSGSDAANSILEVYHTDGTLLFRRTSKAHYLNACALSPDGSFVAAAMLSQQDVSFTSVIQIFRTDAEDPVAEVAADCGLVFDMAFLNDGTLCAIGTYGLVFLDTAGNLTGEYSFMDAGLTGYCMTEGRVALTLDTYDLTARYRLVLLDAAGHETAACTLQEGADSVSLCGSYAAVLSDTTATVYTAELEPIASVETGGAYTSVCVRKDGTALLIGDRQTELLIP